MAVGALEETDEEEEEEEALGRAGAPLDADEGKCSL